MFTSVFGTELLSCLSYFQSKDNIFVLKKKERNRNIKQIIRVRITEHFSETSKMYMTPTRVTIPHEKSTIS
jgi:hypothetical protein